MKGFAVAVLFFWTFCVAAQDDTGIAGDVPVKEVPKATIDMYRIITLDRDTTFVDTSLTIQSHYKFNILRRDHFGLLPFPNEGQPYNVLHHGLRRFSAYPEMGHNAKHFNYYQASDINYYSVATPLTELYFKTVMEQGQSLDAFLTINTSEQLNFSIAYKGLRSLGKYINQLSSSGNFRFTTSYHTAKKRYAAKFHFVAQDILNGENGGITNIIDFESENPDFDNRARLEVFFRNAESLLEGKRLFLDHRFRINKEDSSNDLFVTHQVNYEYKFFEFRQQTLVSEITNPDNTVTEVLRFGDPYVNSNLHDRSRYNRLYNKIGVAYDSDLLGIFTVFAEDFRYNYFFDRVLILGSGVIPSSINEEIAAVGGRYDYRKGRWSGFATLSNSVSGPAMSNFEAGLTYQFNDRNEISAGFANLNKLPDLIYNLNQSNYIQYNWSNDFNNEKINRIRATAKTQWANVELQLHTITDKLYFSDNDPDIQQIISPKQYEETIGYLSLEVAREFRVGKFALDNRVLYQEVTQEDNILNVPKFTTRNTLYYSDRFFKRALYVQTGVTFNYFTEYYANDYNPLIGEFFVQEERKIGNFPVLDFFVNARVRQTRIFLKAEHFNSLFTGNNFYSAPNYPYRDFMVRFGLVWNFFQ